MFEKMSFMQLKKLELEIKQELLKREIKQVDCWIARRLNSLSSFTKQVILVKQEELHRELAAFRVIYIEDILNDLRGIILRVTVEWLED